MSLTAKAKGWLVPIGCGTLLLALPLYVFFGSLWGMRTRKRTEPTLRDIAIIAQQLNLRKTDEFSVERFEHIFTPSLAGDTLGACACIVVFPRTNSGDAFTSWSKLTKHKGLPYGNRSSLIEWFHHKSLESELGFERTIPLRNVVESDGRFAVGVSWTESSYAFCADEETNSSRYFILMPWRLFEDHFYAAL